MKESIKIFENAQFGQIRTSISANGEPLFCLADVCKALDLSNPRDVKRRLQPKGVCTTDTPTNGGIQQLNFITEPNLYKCIFQSRKKEAEQFQDWVCGEVLPSIRKSGGYMVAKVDETPEQIMARALMLAKETIDRQQAALAKAESKNYVLQCQNDALTSMNEGQQEQIMARALMLAKETIDRQQAALAKAESKNYVLQCQNDALTSMNEGQQRTIKFLQPGATFAKAVETSEHSILVGELARIIKQNGVEIGQNRLFAWLREKGYLCKATFAKAVETSEHSILVGELARIIKQNGVEIGQNRLFAWLREKGYLCKKGEMYNQPTQKALQLGLFEIKKTVIQKPNGDSLVTTTTKVTGKGQIYFVNKFLYESINEAELAKQAEQAKKGGAQ